MHVDNLPNFFIPGAAKAGTSSLYAYLKQHPQIYLPTKKEPHFFDDDRRYQAGVPSYLERHFKTAHGYPARGEASAGYLRRYQDVIPRMLPLYEQNPPRFIVMLRDPVARAWSHYLHRCRTGWERESFERGLELEQERLSKSPARWVGYFTDGLYARQFEHWLKYFPKEQFLAILTEDLADDPVDTLKRAFDFLGVDPSVDVNTGFTENKAAAPKSILFARILGTPSLLKAPLYLLPRDMRASIKKRLTRVNNRVYGESPKINDETARMLREKYAPDILRLEKIIDRDLSMWLPQ